MIDDYMPCLRCGKTKRIDTWCNSPECRPFVEMTQAKIKAQLITTDPEENERLRERIADYENRITWDTTCGNCARLLDASIKDYERAEEALARLEAVKAAHSLLHGRCDNPICPLHHALSVAPEPTVEIGGQVMTQAQFDAARFPLLNSGIQHPTDPTPSTSSSAAPEAFIQWKGTNVCLDFYCPCGMQSHLDGDFAYALQCPSCDRVFDLPTTVQLTERGPGPGPVKE
jgi:hypothetical protein